MFFFDHRSKTALRKFINYNRLKSVRLFTDTTKPVTALDREKSKEIYISDDTETIKIQAGEITYTLTRKIKFVWQQGKLKLGDGDDVKFAFDGEDFMYLINPKGKKIKYYISKIENPRDEVGN